jgi:hypothetical protein
MPIEIKELIIKATIEQSNDNNRPNADVKAMESVNTQMLIEQMVRELSNINER